MKTREQNRNSKRTEIERFDWFIERIQSRVAFGWLSERSGKKLHARELSRNQSILRFDVILQHDWPIEQCLLHIRVFFGGKTKSPCFDLFIRWLMKQMTNTYRNQFSKSYENRSNSTGAFYQWVKALSDIAPVEEGSPIGPSIPSSRSKFSLNPVILMVIFVPHPIPNLAHILL